jgi:hypothetical protein
MFPPSAPVVYSSTLLAVNVDYGHLHPHPHPGENGDTHSHACAPIQPSHMRNNRATLGPVAWLHLNPTPETSPSPSPLLNCSWFLGLFLLSRWREELVQAPVCEWDEAHRVRSVWQACRYVPQAPSSNEVSQACRPRDPFIWLCPRVLLHGLDVCR